MILWLLLAASVALNVALWNRLLPFPDYGSFIAVAKDDQARAMLLKLLYRYCRWYPAYRVDSQKVSRVIFRSGLILNVNDPGLLAELGMPGGGFAIPTDHPGDTAAAFAHELRKGGYTADIHAEPGMEHAVVLLRTDALMGMILVFRLPTYKMDKPPAWHA